MMIKWIIDISNQSTLFESDAIQILTQSEDFHENFKLINDQANNILFSGDVKDINVQLKSENVYAYANKGMKDSINKSHEYEFNE